MDSSTLWPSDPSDGWNEKGQRSNAWRLPEAVLSAPFSVAGRDRIEERLVLAPALRVHSIPADKKMEAGALDRLLPSQWTKRQRVDPEQGSRAAFQTSRPTPSDPLPLLGSGP